MINEAINNILKMIEKLNRSISRVNSTLDEMIRTVFSNKGEIRELKEKIKKLEEGQNVAEIASEILVKRRRREKTEEIRSIKAELTKARTKVKELEDKLKQINKE